MERPSFIGNYLDFLDDDIACYSGSSELLSIGSAIGKKLGLERIAIHIEVVPSGRRTSYPHAEMDEEEFCFILEGTPDAWINGHLHPLKPGDFVAFPAGTGICHTFINNSLDVVRLLVGGEKNKPTNKIFYPLNDEENQAKRVKGKYWEDVPIHPMGPHNGKPSVSTGLRWSLPTLETERLILRPFELGDTPDVFKYASDPEVAEFVTWTVHKTLEDSKNFIKFVHSNYLRGIPDFAVTLKEGDDPNFVIGSVGAFWSSRPHKVIELGAVLNKEYWGNRIMTEALTKLIQYVWENFDVNRIQLRCLKENYKSYKMIQKLGARYEGTLQASAFIKGKSRDMEMFSFVRS